MAWSGGLSCKSCQADFAFQDIPFRIQATPDGSLLWLWLCGICDRLIRSEPFSFPPDYEPLALSEETDGESTPLAFPDRIGVDAEAS